MKAFTVPAKADVSTENAAIFDNLTKAVGMVPNLYAAFAKSAHGLGNYLTLQSSKTSLSAKEKEVINLVVSQVNECLYCLSAHTAIAKMNGFTDEQILSIRRADAGFDPKLSALAKLTQSIAAHKGHATDELLEAFYTAGYTEGSLVDVVILVGDKIITNYLHALTAVPIDWPLAPALAEVAA